jgi:23S rRNA pseudouridine1911/1915/1917 synthase
VTADQLHTLTVGAGEGGRLDRLVAARLADLSRTAVQRLIDDGCITRNAATCKASEAVEPGDIIVVRVPPPALTELIAEDIPLTIVYEDSDLIVIDKPAGLVVHPAAGHDHGTVVNALLGHLPNLGSPGGGIGGEVRPGIVHRLDKDTSGLMVAAKNDRALQFLQEQFKARTVKKMYLALADGIIDPREGIIDAPIGRSKADRKKMAVTHEGRSARTRYRVRQIYRQPDLSLVEAYPETGRTHQIRVHLAWIKHPLVGDAVYGRQKPIVPIERHFLHAAALTLTLLSGEVRTFTAPLPKDLVSLLETLSSKRVS